MARHQVKKVSGGHAGRAEASQRSGQGSHKMWATLMAQNAAQVNALWADEDKDGFEYYCRVKGTRCDAIMSRIEKGESAEKIAAWLLWKEYRKKPDDKGDTLFKLNNLVKDVQVYMNAYTEHEEMKAARAAGGEVWLNWQKKQSEKILLSQIEDADKIREMYMSGMTAGQISKKLGMGMDRVGRVCDAIGKDDRMKRNALMAEKNGGKENDRGQEAENPL